MTLLGLDLKQPVKCSYQKSSVYADAVYYITAECFCVKELRVWGNWASGIFIPDVFSVSSEIFPSGGLAACMGVCTPGGGEGLQLPVLKVCTRGVVNM